MPALLDIQPQNINLTSLCDVLDTLKPSAVSDKHIKNTLAKPPTEWKSEIMRGQSANIDAATANNRVPYHELEGLFAELAAGCDPKVFEKLMELSLKLEEIPGVLYKNDPF